MPSKDKTLPNDCQLQVAYDAADSLTIRDKMRHCALKLMSAIERRTERIRAALGQTGFQAPEADSHFQQNKAQHTGEIPPPARDNRFRPGETVEVLTWEEIQQTLDENRTCGGLQFMEGMKRFCGQRMVVRKRVRTIFDERTWRMLKIGRTHILDGAICDGRRQYSQEGCDRCCFYFWKDRWLRKLQ